MMKESEEGREKTRIQREDLESEEEIMQTRSLFFCVFFTSRNLLSKLSRVLETNFTN